MGPRFHPVSRPGGTGVRFWWLFRFRFRLAQHFVRRIALRRMCSEKSGTAGQYHWGVAALVALLLSPLLSLPVFAQYDLKSRRDYYVGDHPMAVLAVDFDGDGVTDLMSADELSDYLSLVKGFGDGTFRRTSTLVAGSK